MYSSLELFSLFRELEIACFNETTCKIMADLLNVRTSTYLLNFLKEAEDLKIDKKTDVFSKMLCKGIEQIKIHVLPKAHNLTLASKLKKIPLGNQTLYEFLSGFNLTDGVMFLQRGQLSEYPELKGQLRDVLDKAPSLVAGVNAREKENALKLLECCETMEAYKEYLLVNMSRIDFNTCFMNGTTQASMSVGATLCEMHTNGADKESAKAFVKSLNVIPEDIFILCARIDDYWEIPHSRDFRQTDKLKRAVKANMELFYHHRDTASSTQLGGIIIKRNDLLAFYNGILWNEYCQDPKNKAGYVASILSNVPEHAIHTLDN